jgi:hypothetical protein
VIEKHCARRPRQGELCWGEDLLTTTSSPGATARRAIFLPGMASCVFCDRALVGKFIAENGLAVAFPDVFPVSRGHTPVIPRRHEPSFPALPPDEQRAAWSLPAPVRRRLGLSRPPAELAECGPAETGDPGDGPGENGVYLSGAANRNPDAGGATRKAPPGLRLSGSSGPFVDSRCERLGGVGVFNVRLLSTGIEYRFALFENPYPVPAALLPRNFADAYPRHTGANPAPAAVGGKPWFTEVLTDDEWLGDPSKKAFEEALTAIAEFERRRSVREADAGR